MGLNKRLYFGWYIVFSASIITLLTMGMRLGIGPFVTPVMGDLNISRTDFSIIIAVGMIVYGLGMPLAGYLANKYSTRLMMLIGLSIVCLSIGWTVLSKGTLSFLLSYGVLLSLGLALLSNIALSPIVSKWFLHQKGKALFFLSTGGMAGIAVITPLETWLISAVGWKVTLIILGGVFVSIVLPAAMFIMKENVPAGADGRGKQIVQPDRTLKNISFMDAVKTRAYFQIVFGLFACGFGMNLLGSHGVPMLIDHGFNPMTASFGVGMIGFVAIFSTVLLGQFADRYPRKNLLFLIYFIRGLGFFGLVLAATNWQLYLVAFAGGLVWAGNIAMSTAILSDLFGVRLLGLLNGWAFFIGHQVGAAIGSFLGGYAYEIFGTHVISFGLAAILAILASLASVTLPTNIDFDSEFADGKLKEAK